VSKREIDVGSYDPKEGMTFTWVDGFEIEVRQDGDAVHIRANAAGLTSLAQHLMTLAQIGVPSGNHVHLDSGRELEDGSLDLIIERM